MRIGELLRAVPEQSTRAERARDKGEKKWTRVPSGSDDRSPKWGGFPNERHSSSSQKERENHLIAKSCDVVSCSVLVLTTTDNRRKNREHGGTSAARRSFYMCTQIYYSNNNTKKRKMRYRPAVIVPPGMTSLDPKTLPNSTKQKNTEKRT